MGGSEATLSGHPHPHPRPHPPIALALALALALVLARLYRSRSRYRVLELVRNLQGRRCEWRWSRRRLSFFALMEGTEQFSVVLKQHPVQKCAGRVDDKKGKHASNNFCSPLSKACVG